MTLRYLLALALALLLGTAAASAQTQHAYRPQVIRPAVNQVQTAEYVVQRPLQSPPVAERLPYAPIVQQPYTYSVPVQPAQAVVQAPPSLPAQQPVYQQPAPVYQQPAPVVQAQPTQPLQPVPSYTQPIQPIPANQVAVTAYDPCTCQPITTYSPISYTTAQATPYYYAQPTTPVTPYTTTAQRQVVFRPVIAPFPMPAQYEVGRGIVGQPKIYVPGQPIRNFLRWVTP